MEVRCLQEIGQPRRPISYRCSGAEGEGFARRLEPVAWPGMTARIAALEAALGGTVPVGDDGAWATALVAAGQLRRGWDPTPWTPAWRAALAAAGVPFAAGGDRPTVTIDSSLEEPVLTADEHLRLPPLERFVGLTSLPLKPVRQSVHRDYHVRLQIGAGVHLWLWSNQVVVVNGTADQRDGFLYGPDRGMRLTLSLAPGTAQELTW